MIVFDLKCANAGHVFEGWFGSSADYEDQRTRGLLACPVCGDSAIGKAVMSPAVGAKSNQRTTLPARAGQPEQAPEQSGAVTMSNAPAGATAAPDMAQMRAMISALAQAQAKILENAQWVGHKFAETARAMHYGEEDHHSIYGEVAPEEARALIEEGVEVAPLPLPVVPPEAQN